MSAAYLTMSHRELDRSEVMHRLLERPLAPFSTLWRARYYCVFCHMRSKFPDSYRIPISRQNRTIAHVAPNPESAPRE